MGLTPSLSTSLSGMKAAQGQLDIISRNISNVDTVGYTRKFVQQNNVVRAGYAMGVELSKELRNVNEGLLKSFLAANNQTGYLGARSEFLNKADVLLGTPMGDNSIAANVSNLQKSFENFASDVTTATSRYSLVSASQTLTTRLNSLTQEIQKLRGDADIAVNGSVAEINKYLQEIHTLNDEIVKYEILGYSNVADLEDKRDSALRSLSGLIDITYFERENGAIVIQTTDGVPLLDKEPRKLSHRAIAQSSPTVTYEGGGIGGIYVDGVDITTQLKGGELKGLIDIRDTTLVSLQSQLDELAGVIKESVNQIHNAGTAYPQTPSKMEGDRVFVDPGVQRINIASGDVRFTIFDSAGKEVTTTTLKGGLGFADGTVEDMVTELNNWLRSPTGANLPQGTAYIDAQGKMVIDTGDSDYSFSVMDEYSSTPGSGQKNATIEFDADGNGTYDKSFEGFSSFFGLNNFFVNKPESIYESRVVDRNSKVGGVGVTQLNFSDRANGINYASIDVYPTDTIRDIANRINSDPNLSGNMVASIVPNGSGFMLRIQNTNGEQLEITEAGAGGVISKLGIAPSYVGTAESLAIRSDIVINPALIAAGSPQFNKDSGEYELNAATNDIANALAKMFSESQTFKQTNTLSTTETTLSNYASTFVGLIASETNNADAELKYQAELANSIATKEAQYSAVDLDEELASMIIFQQSYAAAAKSFTAAKEMLDMLLNLV